MNVLEIVLIASFMSVNVMVGQTLINVKFEDIPYTWRAFIHEVHYQLTWGCEGQMEINATVQLFQEPIFHSSQVQIILFMVKPGPSVPIKRIVIINNWQSPKMTTNFSPLMLIQQGEVEDEYPATILVI